MIVSRYKNLTLNIEPNKNIENPLIQRGLVKVYVIDQTLNKIVDFGFKHNFQNVEEAVKSVNKQENIVMYLHYCIKTKTFLVDVSDLVTNMLCVGIVTCSKRTVRTIWHELQRAKKQVVIDKAKNVIKDEIKLMNNWFVIGSFDVTILENGEVVENLSNIMAENDDEMFEKKMNFVNMRGNDYLFEKYVDGFDHHYLAYKFVYNSEFSLEEYVKILGYDFVRNFPFETIINGELKYDVSLKDMPSLEAGETYLIISFTDLSGDYTNPTYWYLYKLDDFKKFQIKEINEL